MRRRLESHRLLPHGLVPFEGGRHGHHLLIQPIDLGLNRLAFDGLLRRRQIDGRLEEPGAVSERADLIVAVAEERHQPVVILLAEGIVLVVVALRAAQRRAEPDGGGRVDAIDEHLVVGLFRIDAPFLVRHRVAVESARDDLLRRRVWQHIAGDLLDREAIERHVAIERVDHPVSILPHHARQIFFEPVRVGVAREIEPRPRPSFAVMRRGEETIHEPRIRGVDAVARGVGRHLVDFLRRRRQADQIERDTAHEHLERRLGRRSEAFLLESRENEAIDRRADPCGVTHGGQRRTRRRSVSPML